MSSSDGGDPDHGWKPLLDELERRQTRARAIGGPERELRNALCAGLDLLETRRARV
jgi:hypothetical protein